MIKVHCNEHAAGCDTHSSTQFEVAVVGSDVMPLSREVPNHRKVDGHEDAPSDPL